jgi:hypothetical protein
MLLDAEENAEKTVFANEPGQQGSRRPNARAEEAEKTESERGFGPGCVRGGGSTAMIG